MASRRVKVGDPETVAEDAIRRVEPVIGPTMEVAGAVVEDLRRRLLRERFALNYPESRTWRAASLRLRARVQRG